MLARSAVAGHSADVPTNVEHLARGRDVPFRPHSCLLSVRRDHEMGPHDDCSRSSNSQGLVE